MPNKYKEHVARKLHSQTIKEPSFKTLVLLKVEIRIISFARME